jgi:hypothetical protein
MGVTVALVERAGGLGPHGRHSAPSGKRRACDHGLILAAAGYFQAAAVAAQEDGIAPRPGFELVGEAANGWPHAPPEQLTES